MKTITLITAFQSLFQCLLLGSLLAFAGTSLATERVTYYHNDALGSPVAATDANGTLLWREEYAPYGERLKKEAGSKDTVWYTGQQEESTFGLSYFGARWYDPRVGRFMGVDPAGFNEDNIHSYSKYAYANNNPYVYVDPDGNFAILGAVVAAVADIATQGLLISAGAQAEFSLGSVAVAAGLGAATGGLANLKKAYDATKTLNNARRGSKATKGAGKEIGMLRDAAKGKGNFGLGSGSRAEADKLGKAWVGDGHKVASDGKTLISKDGLKQFRPPSYKPKLDKTQANFEQRFPGQQSNRWQSNGHLDITD